MPYKDIEKRRAAQRKYASKWYQANKQQAIEAVAVLKARLKQRIDNYKLERGCTDCPYNEHPEALDFDHINDDKIATISKMIRSVTSWRKIKTEIDKCEVVCANCHRVRTFNRRSMPDSANG